MRNNIDKNRLDCYELSDYLKAKFSERMLGLVTDYRYATQGRFYTSYSYDNLTKLRNTNLISLSFEDTSKLLVKYIIAENNFVIYDFNIDKKDFLNITIRKGLTNSLGMMLAALSDFYKILKERYGNPVIFYVDENSISLEWKFKEIYDDIKTLANNNVFDGKKYQDVRYINGNEEYMGLPIELKDLIMSDYYSYIVYKKYEVQEEVR